MERERRESQDPARVRVQGGLRVEWRWQPVKRDPRCEFVDSERFRERVRPVLYFVGVLLPRYTIFEFFFPADSACGAD